MFLLFCNAHREWGGMLKDYYYPRWKTYLAYLQSQLEGENQKEPNLYPMERTWVESHNRYAISGENPVKVAREIFLKYYVK